MSLDMGSSSSLSSMPITSNAPGVDSLQKRQKTRTLKDFCRSNSLMFLFFLNSLSSRRLDGMFRLFYLFMVSFRYSYS